MDELELLKKDWKKEDNKYPKLTRDEIYKMILKKSSSIVKWIFIISLLEFVFWTIISFALKDSDSAKRFESYHVEMILIPLTIIGYIILAYFFYLFFINYKKITATDSIKKLMDNILKTRRTVKQYVVYNLAFLVISMIISTLIVFNQDEDVMNSVATATQNGEAFKFYAITIGMIILVLIAIIGVLLLFYYLIYGILLKRLNRNYKELKKLEV